MTNEERRQKLVLFFTKRLYVNSKKIRICDGRQKVAVEIQKTRCGGRNTDNLIESTCFYLKMSLSHIFFSNFSRVCIFCNADNSKLVPESTQSGGL